MSYGWLSLLTDYGLEDDFVAACHGVVADLAPQVRVIDVTHLVPPGDVRRGAAVLAQTLPYLPPAATDDRDCNRPVSAARRTRQVRWLRSPAGGSHGRRWRTAWRSREPQQAPRR